MNITQDISSHLVDARTYFYVPEQCCFLLVLLENLVAMQRADRVFFTSSGFML